MLQRLNFTGRIELMRSDVFATLQSTGLKRTILLNWKFDSFNFSSNSEIIVDLRSNGTTETKRISIGKIDPSITTHEIDISEMRNPDLARIRLKVCEKDTSGITRIRAQIDNLIPENSGADDNARSFLKLAKDDELDIPWELRFESGEPCLFITGKNELFHHLRNRSPWFFTSVMHEVVRQVFVWLVDQSDYENYDIAEKWKQYFLDLGCPSDFFNSPEDLDPDERKEEVESQLRRVLQTFVKRHNILSELASLNSAEGE